MVLLIYYILYILYFMIKINMNFMKTTVF